MNNNYQEQLKRIDLDIVSIYLTIASSILVLIDDYESRAEVIDKIFGVNNNDDDSGISDLTKLAVIMDAIADFNFLYLSYLYLQDAILQYEKNGDETTLIAAYNSLYANILQFIGTLFILYNTFILNVEITTPTGELF